MMDHTPTEGDGRRALRDHVIERAMAAREKYGPVINVDAMRRLIEDRAIVRYPTLLRFDAEGLIPGEFAHAEPLGEHPKHGYALVVHPAIEGRPDLVVMAIAYHIAPINYGDIAEPEDCEAFGAALLGIEKDAYYDALCKLSDAIK